MELRSYAQLMLKKWWLILLTLLIVLAATAALTYLQTPVYKTTTSFVVSPSASLKDVGSMLQGLDSLSRSQGINETYNGVITSRAILDPAAAALGLTAADLKQYKITSDLVPNSNIIQITVEGSDPVRIAALANHIGSQTVKYVQTLYEAYDLKPLDAATVPTEPILPNKAQNMILATLVGLALGVALAFTTEYMRVPTETLVDTGVLDQETGLYNKSFFTERLGQELSRSKRQNYPLSIGLMQIERLNTVKGPSPARARAQALRQVAISLKQLLRPEDIIARVGPNQFAFLFPDTPGSTAKEILEAMQRRIESTAIELGNSGVKVNLTSSSGVMTPHNGAGPDELLSKVEQAMRRAGASGYNKIYLWEENHNEPVKA